MVKFIQSEEKNPQINGDIIYKMFRVENQQGIHFPESTSSSNS